MLGSCPLAPLLFTLAILSANPPAASASPGQDDEKKEGFANPDLLVTTAWLAEHGHDEGVSVVDARGAKDFAAGHVPGAVSIPLAATYDPEASGNIGSPEQIAALLGAQGIAASTHVVIYDEGKSTTAARFF